MKSCELCKFPARMYCDSDQASLCWDCDAKVHSANFLVARHSRSLLCNVCQSPTAWSASGEKLGRTVSVCECCAASCDRTKKIGDDEIDREDEYDEDDDGDEDEDEDDEDEDEDEDEDNEVSVDDDDDGDIQVVPWSSTPPPPSTSSSSSSEEESSSWFCNGNRDISSKRLRENAADLHSDDDQGCSSSRRNCTARSEESSAFVDSMRPLKNRRIETIRSVRVEHGPTGSRSAAIGESIQSFREQVITSGEKASPAIVGNCRPSNKNSRAVDLGIP